MTEQTNDILFEVRDGIGRVTFNRPQARNAFTFQMYERLAEICEEANGDPALKALILTGAGDKAFASGTDINQFRAFKTPQDAIDYEARNDRVLGVLEQCRVPTVAAITGACTGGGAGIAACCDLRIGTKSARFGFPIARTLGNCLSVGNVARLVAQFGPGRTKRMLMLAEMISAEEAAACGFVDVLAAPGDIDTKLGDMCKKLLSHAPITMRNAKEAVRRIRVQNLPDGADLIRAAYGSADFKEGIDAFLAKRPPNWQGR